jgi:hypothetical protein
MTNERYPHAPISDNRNEIISVFDHRGIEHKHSRTNARDLIGKSAWTCDPREAEKRRENPLEPVKHVNREHGIEGVTSRHLEERTSSPVINGIVQFPLKGA